MKSHIDFKSHKLQKEEARKLVIRIIKNHSHEILFSRHALEELSKDGLTVVDVMNVLSSPDAKILNEAEFEKGSYRYRLETGKICLVLVFVSNQEVLVVTVWRKKNEMC